jgi:predicted RNA-binding protein with PUA-like domain
MAEHWLIKTDPTRFTFDDLVEEGRVTWRDVTQPQSLAHLRRMKRGDDVLLYHAGSQRAVVGLARVRKGAYLPAHGGDGLHVVDLAPVEALARPVTLKELRGVPALSGWALLRVPRLHVMPVPAGAWRKVLGLADRG